MINTMDASHETVFDFDFGTAIREKITGMKGVVISQITYANGCIQYGVQPSQLDKEGGMRKVVYLDMQDVEFDLSATSIDYTQNKVGGPRSAPKSGPMDNKIPEEDG